MDETSELVAMLGAVAGIIVATGGLFKVVPPIIDARRHTVIRRFC